MAISNLGRQLRFVLEAPDALLLAELLVLVDGFVLECSSVPDSHDIRTQFEEELQAIYDDVVDHSSLLQKEVALAVLYHLRPIFPSASVISWFDLLLRPALREPKLSTPAVTHAKELIVSALQKNGENFSEIAGDFRRRLMDLYLLDAFNETSSDDALEWAELNQDQKEIRTCWKSNLEDVLIKFGMEQPYDFMTELYIHFSTPSSRLQILTLLHSYISGTQFETAANVLGSHPLISRVLCSLLLDNSSTVCTTGLTLFVKLLPMLAVHACEDLKILLPKLLAILARAICWKKRRGLSAAGGDLDAELDRELAKEANPPLQIRSDLDWNRLDATFNGTPSTPPNARPFFSMLYYLYPCNVLRFLRGPALYLEANSWQSPFTVNWDQALDEERIRKKSEPLIREHMCHPLLIWRDATSELSATEFWAKYDVSRIASEAMLLDMRNTALAIRAQAPVELPLRDDLDLSSESTRSTIPPQSSVSLQDMINTSIALKSSADVAIIQPASQWPQNLFTSAPSSPLKGSIPIPRDQDEELPSHVASHVTHTISGLQREILLLRNELNFELWLSRENTKHIGRLFQERILTKSAEAERQGWCYNKLRKYRAQVIALEGELREHKQQASSAKNKYADWNIELQKKLSQFREEKKSLIKEAAALRSAEGEARALFTAQAKLLAEATKQVFELQTQKKENQHKIDRLKDYERQLDQHVKMQRLWDRDFAKFNQCMEEMALMRNQFKQMEMRLESYEKTQIAMDDCARGSRRQVQTLEARLAQQKRNNDGSPHQSALQIAAFASEKAALNKTNTRLKEENVELREEIEEMRAMVEVLKGQHSGRRGLVSEPRASPILYV
ncbi:hypothetical protein BD779DRAFT_1434819 [Infundibulicybe gibba]|nr:hypothetical protein BD779DRAFT_1434819 [Infundibulicybe gibba]